MSVDPVERELVVRAVGGDAVALNQILYRNFDRLVQYISNRLPPEERNIGAAEDVTQEAMVVAAREIAGFKPIPAGDGGFFPWLSKIAEHRMLDVLKARRAQKRGGGRAPVHMPDRDDTDMLELLSILAVSNRTPSKSAARWEAIQAVQRGLTALEPELREVLQLRFLQEVPVAEIAERTGRTEGAVYMLCHRAIGRLREQMGEAATFLSWKGD